jgi:hypothetical protein
MEGAYTPYIKTEFPSKKLLLGPCIGCSKQAITRGTNLVALIYSMLVLHSPISKAVPNARILTQNHI